MGPLFKVKILTSLSKVPLHSNKNEKNLRSRCDLLLIRRINPLSRISLRPPFPQASYGFFKNSWPWGFVRKILLIIEIIVFISLKPFKNPSL